MSKKLRKNKAPLDILIEILYPILLNTLFVHERLRTENGFFSLARWMRERVAALLRFVRNIFRSNKTSVPREARHESMHF